MATTAHKGQKRKYTGDPYIVHPVAVAKTVSLIKWASEDMICAALLHDVIEDTAFTEGDLCAAGYGKRIVDMVVALSALTIELPRAERKQLEAQRLGYEQCAVQTIKVADLMDNTRSIVVHDPNFAKTYLAEKSELLHNHLTKADPLLLHLAKVQLYTALEALEILNGKPNQSC